MSRRAANGEYNRALTDRKTVRRAELFQVAMEEALVAPTDVLRITGLHGNTLSLTELLREH